ncbi:hypothetical protein PVAG01_10430 [Phlyctema vagabunda]|uniref:Cytochrome oxidase subunit 1 n=1 Tax=Phlyctema vagabunda TaxID=108571 RepID=A0ABR4P5X6_9HELO
MLHFHIIHSMTPHILVGMEPRSIPKHSLLPSNVMGLGNSDLNWPLF